MLYGMVSGWRVWKAENHLFVKLTICTIFHQFFLLMKPPELPETSRAIFGRYNPRGYWVYLNFSTSPLSLSLSLFMRVYRQTHTLDREIEKFLETRVFTGLYLPKVAREVSGGFRFLDQ